MNRNNKIIKFLIVILSIIAFGVSSIYIKDIKKANIVAAESNKESWQNDLYTPTMIQKIEDDYFIIDCWHHRIIYNKNIKDDISNWSTLTDEIKGGHSIASDGQIYICDDTDNSILRVFMKDNNKFKQTQIIEGITGRPHFVQYDEKTKLFYVISSGEGKIWAIKNNSGKAEVIKKHIISELQNSYVRSFNIIDSHMYFVSGPGNIYKVRYDDSYEIVETYKVPDDMIGMNFIEKIGDYYYITSYTNNQGQIAPKFVRIKNLDDLRYNKYEDLYEKFGFKGTPYYISKFDNKYFITEIDGSSGIKSFEVNNNEIENISTIYYFEGHTNASEIRKKSKYN